MTPFVHAPARPALDLLTLQDVPERWSAVDALLEGARAGLASAREHLPLAEERAADAELDPSHFCLVIAEGARLLGFIEVFAHEPEPGTITLGTIALAPEARGRGLGPEVLALVRDRLSAEHGRLRWVAGVKRTNAVGLRFFEKLGWPSTEDGGVVLFQE